MRGLLAFLSFQWCVLFVPCVPLHVTFVIVLCFLSFVLIACMFACLFFCQRGAADDWITLCQDCIQSLDPKHSRLSALYFVILHQCSCGCWCLWINCLHYLFSCLYSCLFESCVVAQCCVVTHWKIFWIYRLGSWTYRRTNQLKNQVAFLYGCVNSWLSYLFSDVFCLYLVYHYMSLLS